VPEHKPRRGEDSYAATKWVADNAAPATKALRSVEIAPAATRCGGRRCALRKVQIALLDLSTATEAMKSAQRQFTEDGCLSRAVMVKFYGHYMKADGDRTNHT
jgi:hypothetical protein